jgi:hypothetical protein
VGEVWQNLHMVSDLPILGEAAAAAICAVEGLHLTPAYRARIDELTAKGLTNDQIREVLVADLRPRNAA